MDNITLIDNIISVTMPVISPNISNIIKIKYDKNILSPIYNDDFDNYNTGKHILSVFINTNIPEKLQKFIETDKIDIKKYFNLTPKQHLHVVVFMLFQMKRCFNEISNLY